MKRLIFVFLTAFLVFFAQTDSSMAGAQIVINKATNQLQYWKDNTLVKTFPVATGKPGSPTPEGSFTIQVKFVDPYYSRLNIPGGSPNNPLGCRWLGLNISGGSLYGIHGTNNPSSIGTYVSAGCIRMHNQDVIWLYNNTPIGTTVKIINSTQQNPPTLQTLQVKYCGLGGRKDTEIKTMSDNNGAPLLPLREISEFTGYKVTWDNVSNTTVITNQTGIVSINLANGSAATGTDSFVIDETKVVNGTAYVSINFWQKAMPNMEVIRDQKQNIIIFRNKSDSDLLPGPNAGSNENPAFN